MHRPKTLDDRSGSPLPDSFVEHTLHGRFSIAAHRFGERPAIIDVTRTLSYRELEAASDDLARLVVEHAGQGQLPVCLLIDQGADLIIAILAVLKSGRAYVPVDGSDSPGEIRAIIADAGASLLICDEHNLTLASRVTPPGVRCLPIHASRELCSPTREMKSSPDDDAYIYYTSGTTGPPKGVVDVHRNVLHNVLRYTNSLAIDREDRLSLIQSSNFSGTVSTIFSGLLNGAAVCPFEFRRRGAGRLAQWINETRITVFHSVPFIFEQLVETGLRFPSIRLIRLEGDRMLPRHLTQFKSHFGKDCILVNGLASTETGLIRQNFLTSWSDDSAPVVPVGYPVRDMDVAIRTPAGTDASGAEIGEIVVRSPYLAKGYWRRPDLTAAKFVGPQDDPTDRYFRTGDLGRILPDGCLEHLGRGDTLTRIRGRYADLSAVEHALCQLDQIRHALVKPDESLAGEQLVAYVVRNRDVACNASDLRLALSGSIPAWLVPAHFVFLDALPIDRHGKIARQLLPARSHARPELAVPYHQPKSQMEKRLAECFASVLHIRPIGVHDSFFDLGGDSLSATALSFEIEQMFEVRLSPELLFDNPTVATLLARLRDHRLSATAYPIRSTGSLPPLFCIHVFNHFASGYRRLAELLDEDQPVYVLRDSPPLVSVEEFAASYLQAMQTVQPAGPYRLCGNCLSGTIAYEMARQLQAKGEAVEFLGLIDTAFPPRKVVSSVYEAEVSATSRWHHFSRSRLAKFAVKFRLPFFRSWLKLHHAIEIAEERYRPKPISGNLVLFTLGYIDNQAGWLELCGDRLAIVPIAESVPPDTRYRPHLTDEPYVSEFAGAVATHLRR